MLTIETLLDRPYRSFQGDLTSFVMLNLTARASVSLPVNLALMIDVSGSMEGDKLTAAKEAARLLCLQLKENDSISLLSFGSEVKILVSACPVAGAREQVLREIDDLEADGVTLLRPALSTARSELAKNAAGRASFAVLITDGYPTDTDGNVDEETGLYLAEAGDFAGSSASLITVGLGDAENYNRSFLQALADRGNGRFEYSYDPAGLKPFFREQLNLMQNTSISDAEIVFTGLGGSVQRIARVIPDVQLFNGPYQEGSVVKLGPLPENKTQSYVIEMITPEMMEIIAPGSPSYETKRLCDLKLNYKTASGSGSKNAFVDINYTSNPTLLERVDNNVRYMAKYLEMSDAMAKAEDGKNKNNMKLTVNALKKVADIADQLNLTQQAMSARTTLNKTVSGGLAGATRHDLAVLTQNIRKTQRGGFELNSEKKK